MKIQVLMGFSLPIPPLHGGAVEKVWYNLARQLSLKHDVIIYSCSHGELPAEHSEGRLRHVRLPGFSWSNNRLINITHSSRWSLRLLDHVEDGDILITNDFIVPEIFSRYRRKSGLVCVQVQRMPKTHYRWLYKETARMHCPSNAVLENMKAISPDAAKKCRVIPNPTDINIFSPKPENMHGNGKYEILYVCRVHPEKGISLLLQAFTRCRERAKMFLRIVGPTAESSGGHPGFGAQLRQLATELGLQRDEWALEPPVFDDVKLAEIFRNADIFVYPSQAIHGETFGVSVLEAMASGLPSIVSGLTCFRDLITDNYNGLIVADDRAASWARALDTLVLHQETRRYMAVRSREVAVKYSYQNIAATFEEDFYSLIKNS